MTDCLPPHLVARLSALPLRPLTEKQQKVRKDDRQQIDTKGLCYGANGHMPPADSVTYTVCAAVECVADVAPEVVTRMRSAATAPITSRFRAIAELSTEDVADPFWTCGPNRGLSTREAARAPPVIRFLDTPRPAAVAPDVAPTAKRPWVADAVSAPTVEWSITATGVNALNGIVYLAVRVEECAADAAGAPLTPRVLRTYRTDVAAYRPHVARVSLRRVLERKAATVSVPTAAGRVVVRFSVAPSDVEGYAQRLERIFTHQGASEELRSQTLALAAQANEATAFAHLWHRLNLTDYTARLRRFFDVYAPERQGAAAGLLRDHQLQEEDLFGDLVTQYGPEPFDFDAEWRIDAFKRLHPRVPYQSAAVVLGKLTSVASFEERCEMVEQFMDDLKARFGKEPAPSRYRELLEGAPPPAPASVAVPSRAPGTTAAAVSIDVSAPAAPEPPKDSWATLVAALHRSRPGRSEDDLYLLTPAAFDALLDQCGIDPSSARVAVAAEWRRRVATALQQRPLQPHDDAFAGASRDLATLYGGPDASVPKVTAAVELVHPQHERAFQRTVAASAPLGKTERWVLVGSQHDLLEVATYGIGVLPDAAAGLGVAFTRQVPPAAGRAVSVLVCDIALGRCDVRRGTADLARRSDADDSVLVSGAAGGDTLYVRDAARVLPRYLLHLTVAPPVAVPSAGSGMLCAHHPHRVVEFFCVEDQAFVCPTCAVVGTYAGRPLVTLEEAAQWAQQQLRAVADEAAAVRAGARGADADLAQQRAAATGDALQRRKEATVAAIMREAEARAQEACRALDAECAAQVDRIERCRQVAVALHIKADEAFHAAEGGATNSNVAAAVAALRTVSERFDVADLRARTDEVRGAAVQLARDHQSAVIEFERAREQHQSRSSSMAAIPTMGGSGVATPRGGVSRSASAMPVAGGLSSSATFGNASSFAGGVGSAYGRFLDAASAAARQRQQHTMRNSSRAAAVAGSTSFATDGSPMPPPRQPLRSSSATVSNRDVPNPLSLSARGPPTAQASFFSRGGGYMDLIYPSAAVAGDMQQQTQQQHPLEQQSADKKLASALLKDGWRAFRRGDGPTARELWTHAASRFPSSAAACRARAYIAEALDRDNATAARHYEQALRAEPTDTTTLFNYGVLLETTDLNSALSMFDRGAQLGDAAAGERASVLRAQIDELRR